MPLSWLFSRRRKRLAAPFPAAWEPFLNDNCWQFRFLPAEKQERLRRCVKVIVPEQTWVGVSGLATTDEVKVTIAAQAALLLLGVDDYYFDKVTSILVHPRRFENRTTNADLHKRLDRITPVVGEAHQHGPIVLTWPEALAGGRGELGGSNLVLHEFAHHLDSLDGHMEGTPPLPSRESIRRWTDVTTTEYEQLVDDLRNHRPGLLDPYAATSKAEFFAVATESFFELPHAMSDELPQLFSLLCDFYRIDPTAWWPDVSDD